MFEEVLEQNAGAELDPLLSQIQNSVKNVLLETDLEHKHQNAVSDSVVPYLCELMNFWGVVNAQSSDERLFLRVVFTCSRYHVLDL